MCDLAEQRSGLRVLAVGQQQEGALAANPGEPPAPLAAVASGGEAARIMLALESVLVANQTGRCLVFDEVDTGVGAVLTPTLSPWRRTRSWWRRVAVTCGSRARTA